MVGGSKGNENKVEVAMIEAIKKAHAEGIADPEVIRQRIRKAIDEATNG